MNEEAKKMMALAGIKEDDKKFLTNESFSENKKISDPTFDGQIKIKNKETGEWEDLKEIKEPTESDSDFIIMEFEQEEIEPGEDDDKLYTLK